MDAKARVADWLRAQPSVASEDALSWSIVTTGPYMELLLGVAYASSFIHPLVDNHSAGPIRPTERSR